MAGAAEWFGADEPCFCGSGRLYSSCHQEKIYKHLKEIEADHLKFVKWWPSCGVVQDGHPCGRPIVSSHSLQRKGTLRSIAEDHQVFTSSSNKHGLAKSKGDRSKLVKVGTRSASTFRGLCATHDETLFEEIERFPLKLTYRACLGLAYRSILYEALEHTKSTMWLDWLSTVPKFEFQFNTEVMGPELDNMHFYSSYNWEQLKRLENIQKRQSTRKFCYVAIEFYGQTDFTTTGNFCIELDFDGHVIQDFSQTQLFSYAQISVIQHEPEKWCFVLSATNDQNPKSVIQLLSSLLHQERTTLTNCALRAALVHVENTYFRPSWVENLTEAQEADLVQRLDYGSDFCVGETKAADTLRRPLLKQLDHNVSSISHNIHKELKKIKSN